MFRVNVGTLPETNIAPAKGMFIFQPSNFRCKLLVSGRVNIPVPWSICGRVKTPYIGGGNPTFDGKSL